MVIYFEWRAKYVHPSENNHYILLWCCTTISWKSRAWKESCIQQKSYCIKCKIKNLYLNSSTLPATIELSDKYLTALLQAANIPTTVKCHIWCHKCWNKSEVA